MSAEEIYQKFIDYMNNPVIEFTESPFPSEVCLHFDELGR